MSTICFDTAPFRSVPATRRRRPLAGGLLAGLAGVVSRIGREWRIRRAARQLDEMSDHMLSDIGLNRGDIDHALRNGRPWLDGRDDGRGRDQG